MRERFAASGPVEMRTNGDILANGQLLERLDDLERSRQSARADQVRRKAGDLGPAEPDRACIRPHEAADRRE